MQKGLNDRWISYPASEFDSPTVTLRGYQRTFFIWEKLIVHIAINKCKILRYPRHRWQAEGNYSIVLKKTLNVLGNLSICFIEYHFLSSTPCLLFMCFDADDFFSFFLFPSQGLKKSDLYSNVTFFDFSELWLSHRSFLRWLAVLYWGLIHSSWTEKQRRGRDRRKRWLICKY